MNLSNLTFTSTLFLSPTLSSTHLTNAPLTVRCFTCDTPFLLNHGFIFEDVKGYFPWNNGSTDWGDVRYKRRRVFKPTHSPICGEGVSQVGESDDVEEVGSGDMTTVFGGVVYEYKHGYGFLSVDSATANGGADRDDRSLGFAGSVVLSWRVGTKDLEEGEREWGGRERTSERRRWRWE